MKRESYDGCHMTHEEIARLLGLSERTVIRTEQRAFRKLRTALETLHAMLPNPENANG